MSQPRLRWSRNITIWSVKFVLGLAACFPTMAAQTVDETALRALTDGFFIAYQNEDMNGLKSLWSAKSPELDQFVRQAQQTFAAYEKIALKNLTVRKITVEGAKASLQVTVEMSALEAKTDKPAAGFGKMNRTFHFVKEEGEWKMARCVVSEEELASALVAAKTDEERNALLEAEKELQTIELRKALVEQGERLRGEGDLNQALAIYRLVQRIAEQMYDKVGIATMLSNVGVIYELRGDFAQALNLYQKARIQFEALGDQAGIARVLLRIGVVHRRQGDYAQALDYYQQSLTLCEILDDKKGIAGALHNIGSVHGTLGNHAEALEYFQRALKLREMLGDKARIAGTLYNFGIVHLEQGNYAQALKYLQEVLTRFESLNDKGGIRSTLISIGTVYSSQGNYQQALEYYQKSLVLTRDKPEMILLLQNIGSDYSSLGNYAQALDYFQRSLTLSEELG